MHTKFLNYKQNEISCVGSSPEVPIELQEYRQNEFRRQGILPNMHIAQRDHEQNELSWQGDFDRGEH